MGDNNERYYSIPQGWFVWHNYGLSAYYCCSAEKNISKAAVRVETGTKQTGIVSERSILHPIKSEALDGILVAM